MPLTPALTRWKVLALFFLVIITNPHVFAQRDFRSGYIVKNGDTLKGLVQYRSSHNFESCVFKPGRRQKRMVYTAREVDAYGFYGDKRYESIDVGTKAEPGKAFVSVLSKGAIDLYKQKERYFLAKDDKLEIIQRRGDTVVMGKVYKHQETQKVYARDITYIRKLNMAVSDCGLTANSIKFSQKQIAGLIDKYNVCKKDYVDVASKRSPIRIGASLALGLFESVLTLDEYPGKFHTDRVQFREVSVDLRVPRLTDKVGLTIGYQPPVKFTYAGTRSTTSSVQHIQYDMKLKVSYHKLPISLKYNFGKPNGSLYVRCGMWWGRLETTSFTTISTVTVLDYPPRVGTEQRNLFASFRNPSGFIFGVGYDQRIVWRARLFGEVRFGYDQSFVGTQNINTSSLTSVSVLGGIGF